jgi:L-threonylcarbamoyladenylate synthase
MTQVIAWQNGSATDELVRLSLQILGDGGLVALPTDTSYLVAANASLPAAITRLQRLHGQNRLTLAIKDPSATREWLPGLGLAGKRLSRRLWPGPMVLTSGEGVWDSHGIRLLAEPLTAQIRADNRLELRVPDHEAALEILRRAPWPVALSSERSPTQAGMRSAEALLQDVSAEIDLTIDDGLCFFGQSATHVEVEGEGWKVLHEGVLTSPIIEEQAACRIVFVCTGNTCRSPLAEALCKKRLADRLRCAETDLPRKGFVVLSAGLAAMIGEEAAGEAVEVAKSYGADLERHVSRQASVDLLLQADHVFAMTQSHLDLLAGMASLPGCRPRLLSSQGEDIADPIGGDRSVYEQCASQIWSCLDPLLSELNPR